MTEAYLVDPDSWQDMGGNNWHAQSFTPTADHYFQFLHVQLKVGAVSRLLSIHLYLADAEHKPTGDPISYLIRAETKSPWEYYLPHRKAYRFIRTLLLKDVEYVFTFHAYAIPFDDDIQCGYVGTDAQYSRGIRLYSSDGIDWTPKPDQDCIFGEFGSPPAPDIYYPPPVYHWLASDLITYAYPYGVKFVLATNTPCHLKMYYTKTPPRKHAITRTTRGRTLPWYTRLCFVAFRELEQDEPGDTLYHTFRLSPLDIHQTTYFCFKGTVDSISCPSITALFHFTYLPVIYEEILRPNAPGDRCEHARGTPHTCPDHYKNVYEIIPDEDASRVASTSWPGATKDLYHIQPPALPTGVPRKITITGRFRRDYYPATPAPSVKLSLKSQGVEDAYPSNRPYTGYITITTDWLDYSGIFEKSRATGDYFETEDITDLQIGMWLREPSHPAIDIHSWCTQLYATIEYETLT